MKMRNVFKCVGKPEGKKQLVGSRYGWEDNIKKCIKGM
jgi:hypothetical protein